MRMNLGLRNRRLDILRLRCRDILDLLIFHPFVIQEFLPAKCQIILGERVQLDISEHRQFRRCSQHIDDEAGHPVQ